MRSLFWKIFLSFWLLLTGLMLLLVLTVSSRRHEASHFVFRDVSLVIANANDMVAEYDRGGINAFFAARAKAQARIAGELWILDESGKPIQGGELPEPFKHAAEMDAEVDHVPGAMLIHLPFEHEQKHFVALARFRLPSDAEGQPLPDDFPPPPAPAAGIDPPHGPNNLHERPLAGGFVHPPPPHGNIAFLNDLTLQIPAGILLSSTICFLLARYLTRPITSLRMAAQSIAAGDLKARADFRYEGKDEIGELSRDFNQMASRLEETLNGQQRMFADVSHELRSPLTRLTLALELAKQRSGPEAASALQRIELETTRMNNLVTQILRLAKLEAGVLGKQSEEFSVTSLLDDITGDAEIEAAARRCTLHVINECTANIRANYEALRSAIENVVRNAINYSPAGTAIEITQRQVAPSQVAIEILDHGQGIPEEELEKVFQAFHRADDSRTRSTGGVGLGLAIAQRAIAAHGGSISAANQKGAGLLVKIQLTAVSFR